METQNVWNAGPAPLTIGFLFNRSEKDRMGKPLSRPDCLRQNPQCLGKGDEDEAYIEDCYVPQRSIYDTMRINEQIDQGTKLCQPSRSTLGSGGEMRGDGSTLNSNGTIGADLGSVFVSRNTDNACGGRKLDERVIFDALKLTGDLKMISPPLSIVGPGLPITPSSSGGVAAVAKRRFQGGDKRENPNRRSWKAFMPSSFPEFAERFEASAGEGGENRFSGPGLPSPSSLQPNPFHLQPNTPTSLSPSILTYATSSLSPAPTVSSSPSLTPTVSPLPPPQHPSTKQKHVHPELYKQQKQTSVVPSPTREQLPTFVWAEAPKPSRITSHQSPNVPRDVVIKQQQRHRRTISSSKTGIRQVLEESVESVKTSDSERDSPLLDLDQEDNAPLIPPKPVFCPPTKARTWPRSITTNKRTQVNRKHNFPLLPPLPPLLGEDSNMDEESLYLLDPPSPFLKEEGGLLHGGLPLSPCISQERVDEVFSWGAQGRELRERTASELKFEEDERRILQEFEQQEQELCSEMIAEEEAACQKLKKKAEEERAQREEREWEAVLKLENREIKDNTWERETLESVKWGVMDSPCHWPLLTPPTGFGSSGVPSVSPCPSSGSESDDLFLALERQCEEDEGEEGVEMSVDPEDFEPHTLSSLQEEEDEKEDETCPLDIFYSVEPDSGAIDLEKCVGDVKLIQSTHKEIISSFAVMRSKDCEKEHDVIDKDYKVDFNEDKAEQEEEEISYPTDSALCQQFDSDSSAAHVSKPNRTDITDYEQGRHTQTETDADSGASSQSYGKDCEEKASTLSQSTLNRYPVEIEEETEMDIEEHEEEDEFEPEWDVYEQSESSLDSCQGVLLNHSLDTLQMVEREIDSEDRQDIDDQSSSQDDICMSTPVMGVNSDIKGPDVTLPRCTVPLNDYRDPALETLAELTTGPPKPDSVPAVHLQQSHSASNPLSFPSPSISESCSTGLNAKNSEAVVISDSFVYLAVSAPPECPNDCPPSPLEDLILPSPVSKAPCGPDTEEDRAILSPDSFVYMAAPERPQPCSSEVFSACEDTPDLDLDSCSEGTQSGIDGAEFVLGSLTGDSDWESDGSIVDLSPLMSTNHHWDHLEPGVLQNLFAQTETGQALTCRPQEDMGHSGGKSSSKDFNLESGRSSKTESESPTILPSLIEAKVCFTSIYIQLCNLKIIFQDDIVVSVVHCCFLLSVFAI